MVLYCQEYLATSCLAPARWCMLVSTDNGRTVVLYVLYYGKQLRVLGGRYLQMKLRRSAGAKKEVGAPEQSRDGHVRDRGGTWNLCVITAPASEATRRSAIRSAR